MVDFVSVCVSEGEELRQPVVFFPEGTVFIVLSGHFLLIWENLKDFLFVSKYKQEK